MIKKIKKLISPFLDIDKVKQFYYPFKFQKLWLRMVRSKFKFLGNRTYIDFPVIIKGKENVYIGNDVVINAFVHIWGQGGVSIGDRVMISAHVTITSLTHDYNLIDMRTAIAIKAKVTIENDAWIGSNAVILPGIVIGKGAVIGAGSVVTKNVDAYSIVAGNPAKEIKKRIIDAKNISGDQHA